MIRQGQSIILVLLIVLAYQIGCFFPTNIRLKKRPFLIAMGSISFILAVMHYFIPLFWLLLTSVLLVSPCLQIVRNMYNSSVSIGFKRVFRILGFIISPLFNPLLLASIAIVVTLVMALSKKKDDNSLFFERMPLPNFLMIIHQMHYFSYSYIVLVIAHNFDNHNGFITAFIFALGWVTYTSAQYIFKGNNYSIYLICGHIFLVILLIAMSLCNSDLTRIFLWVLTGFGGGTVFCIKEILTQHNKYDNHLLETSENYGHVFGVIASIILYAIFRNVNVPIFFASICAMLTVLLAFLLRLNTKGDKNHDYSK
jgi:hypothetical protein